MRTVQLTEGLTTSVIALGTWSFGGPLLFNGKNEGWGRGDPKEELETLSAGLAKGVNHIDTADIYGRGRAEETVAAIWTDVPRANVVLATKIGFLEHNGKHNYHPDVIKRHVEESLKRLSTAYVDILYLHHCDFGPNWEFLRPARDCLEDLKSQGLIRAVGLSSWDNSQLLQAAKEFDPDVVQVYRNVMDDAFSSSGLRAFCESRGIGVVFFSALKHGLLLGSDTSRTLPVEDFRRERSEFCDPEISKIMKRRAELLQARFAGSSSPVLKGLISSLFVDNPNAVCLLGARTPAHIEPIEELATPLSAHDASWVSEVYQATTERIADYEETSRSGT